MRSPNSSPLVQTAHGSTALVAAISAFVLIGVPLVYTVWEAVNKALTGNLGAVRLEVVFPAAAGSRRAWSGSSVPRAVAPLFRAVLFSSRLVRAVAVFPGAHADIWHARSRFTPAFD
ncbi:MAG: hypothetical protein OEO20_06830 [Gemmatimonadota bacterium]|nr:hypothetical protein [Gemmatimonadota bacterium]MDH3367901.1 hypothetical protein [Gemmatimonadota bacterium]MDH3478001.1 hypothetical protein [Gemmatimonadota bacterium]MDH3570421.1 hypothetical protein [Gemmatimonadota bacterium]MDH5549053.1 hypothetical protein [Gemmatimonadota bacterium]